MSDLDIAVSIDGAAGLAFTEAAGYLVMSIGPGAHVWRRQTTTAPHVDDEYEVSRSRGPMTVNLQLLVKGSSNVQLASRLVAAVAAVEQPWYTLTAVIEGVTWAWACRAADTSIGDAGSLDARRLAAGRPNQLLSASIPRSPIPVSGPA